MLGSTLRCLCRCRDRNCYRPPQNHAHLVVRRPVVVHLTPWYLPHIGGLERHVQAICQGLSSLDFRIVTPRLPGTVEEEQHLGNTRIVRVGQIKYPGPAGASFATPRTWLTRIARLGSGRLRLRRMDFDILHVHRPPIIELAYLAAKWKDPGLLRLAARRLNRPTGKAVPTILTDHGLFVMPSTASALDMTWFMEFVLEKFDHVICVDPSGFNRAREIQASGPRRSNLAQVHHIPQPMDTSFFAPLPPPDTHDLVIGYSGRWERDGMFLLESLVQARIPGVRFVISGGATEQDLARYRDAFTRSTVLVRPNILELADLRAFYGRIHLLVDFYRGDGCGRSVLEAMSCGRPVLQIRAADTHPIIDGSTGVLVDPNLDSIVDAVRNLQSRTDWLVDLGRRARDAIEAEYRMDLVLDRIERVYRSCL